MTPAHRTRSLRSLALIGCVALVTAAAVIGVSPPSEAHNVVVSSVPAEGEVLTVLPERFVVTTNAALLEGVGAIQVTDADGRFYGDGCVQVDGPSLTAAPALGDAGAYTLVWQAVSEDGHTISGAIAFAWQPAVPSVADVGWDTAPVCGEERPADAAEAPAASAPPAADESPTALAEDGQQPADLTAVWIAGGILLVALLGTVAFLLLRRTTSAPRD